MGAYRQQCDQSALPLFSSAHAAGGPAWTPRLGEIAAVEKINPSFFSRALKLMLLTPTIVEAILDGRQPAEMTLAELMEPFAEGWREKLEAGFRQI